MEIQMPAKRSEKLSTGEKKALREYRKKFDTATECAQSLDISREVLFRVCLAGSGSPLTIQKIRAVIVGEEVKTDNENILPAN